MMQIVEVVFIKDSQDANTGWEFYPVGASAHFYSGPADGLVDQGRAVFRDPQPIAVPSQPPAPPETKPTEKLVVKLSGDWRTKPDYSTWTVKRLRMMAKLAEVPGYSKMRKADLIKALEDNAND